MRCETLRRGEGFGFHEGRGGALTAAGRVVQHPPAPDVTEIVTTRDLAAEVIDQAREPAPARLHAWRGSRPGGEGRALGQYA